MAFLGFSSLFGGNVTVIFLSTPNFFSSSTGILSKTPPSTNLYLSYSNGEKIPG